MHRLSPYKPSQPEETEMRNNFLQQERPTAASSRTAMLDDATSIRSSGSYVGHHPSLLDLNNQNPITPGYPVYPSVEGEPICNLLAGAHISGHPLYMDSHTHHSQGLGDDVTLTGYRVDGGTTCDELLGFEEGTLVPATVLACLLASRGCVYENVDDPAMCHASYSRAFGYEDDPRMSYDRRNYSNLMQSGMSDVWLQPHPHMSFYGNGFESHTAEKGYCPNNANTVADYPYGAAMFNNELSLSLGTLQSNRICQPMAQDHHSEMSCSSITINHDLGRGSEQSTPVETNDGSLSFASYRAPQPLSTLSASNYLLAVKQILADLWRFTLENVDLGSYSSCSLSNMPSYSGECSESGGRESRAATLSLQRQEVDAQKKQLKVLLKMADERYNQCLKEVHHVMSNFRPFTGLDPEVHEHFVLQTTSFFYKSLEKRISAQIHNMKAHCRSDSTTEQEGAFDSSFIPEQWALQQLRRKEHQSWRLQRGLPERSVSVLRAWMFQNFIRPYPKDSEKHMLAIKSGLTRSQDQVSNWFINARVRLWKPMIEEMYAEINRRKTHWKGHITDKSKRGDSSMGIQRFQRD